MENGISTGNRALNGHDTLLPHRKLKLSIYQNPMASFEAERISPTLSRSLRSSSGYNSTIIRSSSFYGRTLGQTPWCQHPSTAGSQVQRHVDVMRRWNLPRLGCSSHYHQAEVRTLCLEEGFTSKSKGITSCVSPVLIGRVAPGMTNADAFLEADISTTIRLSSG